MLCILPECTNDLFFDIFRALKLQSGDFNFRFYFVTYIDNIFYTLQNRNNTWKVILRYHKSMEYLERKASGRRQVIFFRK